MQISFKFGFSFFIFLKINFDKNMAFFTIYFSSRLKNDLIKIKKSSPRFVKFSRQTCSVGIAISRQDSL